MSIFNKRRKQKVLTYKTLGKWGEDRAAKYLKKQGYRILKRSFCALGGEIDIVATKNNVLVFVEVKSQEGKGSVSPESRVGYHKRRQLVKLANYYISRIKHHYDEIRWDIISVYKFGNKAGIHQIENAFGVED